MTREQKQIAVILLGGVVLGVSTWMQLRGGTGIALLLKDRGTETRDDAKSVPDAGKSEEIIPVRLELGTLSEEIQERQAWDANRPFGRNPFMRVARAPVVSVDRAPRDAPGAKFSVSGIVFRNGRGMAMVGDSIVREGDRIGGYEVRLIENDKVILDKDGEEVVLPYEN